MQEGCGKFGNEEAQNLANNTSTHSRDEERIVDCFPPEHHNYFLTMLRSAQGPGALSVLPIPDIRLVSGRGFGSYAGGSIRLGKVEASYKEIRPARVLALLDTCSSAHAVACMTGIFPDNPKSFNSRFCKKMFRDATIPLLCDRNEHVWAFQVGPIGRHHDPTQGSGLLDMSLAFGDALVCCLLLALRSYANDSSVDLSTYFESECEAMNDACLPVGVFEPKPFARLAQLQELIANGTLSVNVDGINTCELFRHHVEWFLSTEKPLQLSPSDADFAITLIDCIVKGAANWHDSNPDSTTNLAPLVTAFSELVRLLGAHSMRLRRIRLDCNEQEEKIIQDEEGIKFESWAISCASMPQLLQKVRKAVHNGSL